jgi:hypothetical protein
MPKPTFVDDDDDDDLLIENYFKKINFISVSSLFSYRKEQKKGMKKKKKTNE